MKLAKAIGIGATALLAGLFNVDGTFKGYICLTLTTIIPVAAFYADPNGGVAESSDTTSLHGKHISDS